MKLQIRRHEFTHNLARTKLEKAMSGLNYSYGLVMGQMQTKWVENSKKKYV